MCCCVEILEVLKVLSVFCGGCGALTMLLWGDSGGSDCVSVWRFQESLCVDVLKFLLC